MPFVLLLVTVVAGCAALPPAREMRAGEPFRLELGAAARVDGLVVRFEELVADSRCPSGVKCVWAGDGEVRVLVREGRAEPLEARLHTHGGERYPQTACLLRRTIRLIELQPHPVAEGAETKRGGRPDKAANAGPSVTLSVTRGCAESKRP